MTSPYLFDDEETISLYDKNCDLEEKFFTLFNKVMIQIGKNKSIRKKLKWADKIHEPKNTCKFIANERVFTKRDIPENIEGWQRVYYLNIMETKRRIKKLNKYMDELHKEYLDLTIYRTLSPIPLTPSFFTIGTTA
jgi:hypothetical protein